MGLVDSGKCQQLIETVTLINSWGGGGGGALMGLVDYLAKAWLGAC